MLPPGRKTKRTVSPPVPKELPAKPKRGKRTIGGRIAEVLDLLETQWHNEADPPNFRHPEPLDGLILTVLSQHTNDRNRDVAFERLKDRWLLWEEAVAAGRNAIEDAIRPAGLAPTKARRILDILGVVHADFGRYSILSLMDRGRDGAREYLLSLPGVGAKTAACVLVFDMGLPAFPVDTHIARICRRVGFADEKMSADDISALLEREVDPSRYLGGHVNIIEHGRAVCRARGPLCGECVVSGSCSFYGGGTKL
ncbi:MAG: endonuclease III [Synergistaceae bacterium]|jgi:endonuclease-3|nr:endonuclease III [Synergistaceae bacterium]